MKQLIAIFFLAAVFLQTFRMNYKILCYHFNKGSFIQNCENKNKPVLKCNGKCQLSKQIQKQEQQDKEIPLSKTDHREDVISSIHKPIQYIFEIALINKQNNPSYKSGLIVKTSFSVFHPPRFTDLFLFNLFPYRCIHT